MCLSLNYYAINITGNAHFLNVDLQIQFFIGMIYATQSIFIDCEYPKWMQYTALVYGATMIALFFNYYIQTYLKPRPKVTAETG